MSDKIAAIELRPQTVRRDRLCDNYPRQKNISFYFSLQEQFTSLNRNMFEPGSEIVHMKLNRKIKMGRNFPDLRFYLLTFIIKLDGKYNYHVQGLGFKETLKLIKNYDKLPSLKNVIPGKKGSWMPICECFVA